MDTYIVKDALSISNMISDVLGYASNWDNIQLPENPDKITKVEVLQPNKVIRVSFANGDVQKAVCSDKDVFELETGISVCVGKHFAGGTKQWNNIIRQGMKLYKKQEEQKFDAIIENIKADIKKKTKIEKDKIRREEREAKERERQIEIQKEAYIRAIKELNQDVE